MRLTGNNILWAKVKEDAKIPVKKDEDLGYDIYACFEQDGIIIGPHVTAKVPTGIASAIPVNYGFILKERGSTGTQGMAQRSGVIDSGYRGEWDCPITNTSDKLLIISKLTKEELESGITDWLLAEGHDDFVLYGGIPDWNNIIIHPYEKAICQAVVVESIHMNTATVSYEELKNVESERGVGRYGSSGK